MRFCLIVPGVKAMVLVQPRDNLAKGFVLFHIQPNDVVLIAIPVVAGRHCCEWDGAAPAAGSYPAGGGLTRQLCSDAVEPGIMEWKERQL